MGTKSLILISFASIIVMVSCRKKSPDSGITEQVVFVKTKAAVESSVATPVYCSGILTSKKVSKLSFKTGGIIARLLVEEGSSVKKGQLLATLDMTEISSQAKQAEIALEKAERDLQHAKNLFADSVATLEQLQNATSAYDVALQNKNIAEFNKRYSSIVAPGNGRIIRKLAEENELVAAGTPVLIFSGDGKDEWIIKTGVSDRDIVALHKDDEAVVEFDAFANKVFKAKVSQISEAADPLSGTFDIEISILPMQEKFINGLVGKVKINSRQTQSVSLIPPSALLEAEGNQGYVFIAKSDDSIAKKVPVTIAFIQNNEVAVLEKLNNIGPVITDGATYLEDGEKVNISNSSK